MKWAWDSLKDILIKEILSTRLRRKGVVSGDRPATWVWASHRSQTSLSLQSIVIHSIWLGLEVTGWFLRSTLKDDN